MDLWGHFYSIAYEIQNKKQKNVANSSTCLDVKQVKSIECDDPSTFHRCNRLVPGLHGIFALRLGYQQLEDECNPGKDRLADHVAVPPSLGMEDYYQQLQIAMDPHLENAAEQNSCLERVYISIYSIFFNFL